MTRTDFWHGKTDATLISNSSDTVLDTIYIRQGAGELWAGISNSADKALDTFITAYSPYSDAGFFTMASTTAEYTTGIDYPLKGCTVDLTTLAASASGMLNLYVKGVYAVRFTAGTAASDTNLTLKWHVR